MEYISQKGAAYGQFVLVLPMISTTGMSYWTLTKDDMRSDGPPGGSSRPRGSQGIPRGSKGYHGVQVFRKFQGAPRVSGILGSWVSQGILRDLS